MHLGTAEQQAQQRFSIAFRTWKTQSTMLVFRVFSGLAGRKPSNSQGPKYK